MVHIFEGIQKEEKYFYIFNRVEHCSEAKNCRGMILKCTDFYTHNLTLRIENYLNYYSSFLAFVIVNILGL